MNNFILFFMGILSGSFGGVLMKKSSVILLENWKLNSLNSLIDFMFKVFTSPIMISGIALYFFSMLIWIYLLSKLSLSYVQPILAMTYVVTPILAYFILHESVPVLRWIGILVIVVGVFIVAKN